MRRRTARAEYVFFLFFILTMAFVSCTTAQAADYFRVTLVMDADDEVRYVPAGGTLELPSVPNTSRMSFIGWSCSDPETFPVDYLPGSRVRITNDRVFYAVYYPYSEDRDVSVEDIPAVRGRKFQEVIFAGDSRIRRALTAIGASVLKKKKIYTVAGSLFTLQDFVTWPEAKGKNYYGEKDLLRMVKAHYKKKGKPIAVVFSLGVNDLKGVYSETEAMEVADEYLHYLPRLQKKLSRYNVRFFFMSVNPVCGDKVGAKSPLCLRAFNIQIKSNLPSGWKYINTYSELMRKGFAPVDYNVEDGTHYSKKTYIKIYTYAMKKINAS